MKKVITGAMLAGLPAIALAQANAFSVLGVIGNIMRILLPLLVTAALLYFIWGVVRYVIAKNSDDMAEAKNVILRGVIGLVAITTIWGLVGFVQSTFGFGSGGELNSENIPSVSLTNTNKKPLRGFLFLPQMWYDNFMIDFINTYILIPTAEAATVGALMAKINKVIINPLITLMFIVAFVVFIWGLFQLFVEQKGNDKSGFSGGLPQGKRHALWGIIGMTIMVSVFGLMQFLINSLGVRGLDPNSSEIGNLSSSGN